MFEGPRIAKGNEEPPYLSPAEEEVLPLLLAGKREWEIAQALEKSTPTVNKQVGRIYQAFGVHSRHELLVKWLANGGRKNFPQNGANGVNTPLLPAQEPPHNRPAARNRRRKLQK